MLSEKPFVCLDIGRSLIHLMVGRVSSNPQDIEVLHVGLTSSEGFRKGRVLDTQQLSDALSSAFSEAEKSVGFPIRSVYLGVDAMLTRMMHIEATKIFPDSDHVLRRSDVASVMRELSAKVDASREDIIDLFPVIYTLDRGRVTLNPLNLTSAQLGVKGFLLLRRDDTLRHVLRALRYAGVQVEGILHLGLAIGEMYLSQEEKTQGSIIMDIGSEGSKIYFFRSGFMQADAFVPIGGRRFTRDIELVLKCSASEAERLKLRYGFHSVIDSMPLNTDTDERGNPALDFTTYAEWNEAEQGNLVSRVLLARLEQLVSLAQQELRSNITLPEEVLLKLVGGEVVLKGLADQISMLWPAQAEVLGLGEASGFPQGGLATFINTYGMVQYLCRFFHPLASVPDPSTWIDLSSEYTQLQPPTKPNPAVVPSGRVSEDYNPLLPNDEPEASAKDGEIPTQSQRNSPQSSRNVGWRNWLGRR